DLLGLHVPLKSPESFQAKFFLPSPFSSPFVFPSYSNEPLRIPPKSIVFNLYSIRYSGGKGSDERISPPPSKLDSSSLAAFSPFSKVTLLKETAFWGCPFLS